MRKPQTLGEIFARALSDARRGIQRCDWYRPGRVPCTEIATEVRPHPANGGTYHHPLCARCAAEFDRDPIR